VVVEPDREELPRCRSGRAKVGDVETLSGGQRGRCSPLAELAESGIHRLGSVENFPSDASATSTAPPSSAITTSLPCKFAIRISMLLKLERVLIRDRDGGDDDVDGALDVLLMQSAGQVCVAG